MSYETVSPKQAHEAMQTDAKVVYVDVRSEQEFAAGHAVGAVNVPIAHLTGGGMSPNLDFLKVMTAKFQKDAPLVIGCQMGGRSARACEVLDGAGFTKLKNIDGGFGGRGGAADESVRKGWSGSSLPVTKTAAPGSTWAELRGKS